MNLIFSCLFRCKLHWIASNVYMNPHFARPNLVNTSINFRCFFLLKRKLFRMFLLKYTSGVITDNLHFYAPPPPRHKMAEGNIEFTLSVFACVCFRLFVYVFKNHVRFITSSCMEGLKHYLALIIIRQADASRIKTMSLGQLSRSQLAFKICVF